MRHAKSEILTNIYAKHREMERQRNALLKAAYQAVAAWDDNYFDKYAIYALKNAISECAPRRRDAEAKLDLTKAAKSAKVGTESDLAANTARE